MKLRQSVFMLCTIATLAALPVMARAQSLADSVELLRVVASTATQGDLVYRGPPQKSSFAIMSLMRSARILSPVPQYGGRRPNGNTPAAWHQGAAGYSRRFASDLGIAAISTTTRYALAEALKEDTLYYRCECKGIFPRLSHAVVFDLNRTPWRRRSPRLLLLCGYSTLCRHDNGGVCLVSRQLWRQVGAADGQLQFTRKRWENILMEFIYSGPHSLLSRMHLHNPRAAPDPDSK